MDVSGGESKVRCYKEQYCIGTWNIRSTNQGKLNVVKQEMAKVNTMVALFVCPSTPFFLDALGLRHGDLKESAQNHMC